MLLPLYVAAFASLFLAGAEAIECYSCASEVNEGCGDPFRAAASPPKVQCTNAELQKFLSDASSLLSAVGKFGIDVPSGNVELPFVCQKTKRTDKNGREVVLRSCAFSQDTVDMCPKEHDVQCLQCTGDLCNAAVPSAITTHLLALVALPIVALCLLRP